MKKLGILFSLLLACAGCGNFPLQPNDSTAFTNPTQYTNQYPKPWFVYDDQLNTGGGSMLWAAYQNVTVNFSSSTSPFRGAYCIDAHFVAGGYTAMDLIHTPDYTTYNTVPGKNLSAANFSKCTFYARSVPAANVKFDAAGTSNTITVGLTGTWTQYTIVFGGPLTAVKDYFVAEYPSVQPCDVYIDDIEYQ